MARILYAEDHADIAYMLQFKLEADGHEVEIAPDGEAALVSFEAGQHDVVLIDVMLPKLDGFALCRRLKDRQHPPVCIVVTARDRDHDRAAAAEAGADDYLVKPVSPQQLSDLITAHLSHPGEGA